MTSFLRSNDFFQGNDQRIREKHFVDFDFPFYLHRVMNGFEASRQLKAKSLTKNIPIIALTAHAMAEDRQKALAAGCDDYDTKPVELERLLQKIREWLEKKAAASSIKPE